MLPPRPFCSPSPGTANKQSRGGCRVVAWGDGWENPRGSLQPVLELLPCSISSEGTCWRGKAPLQPRAAIWGFHPPQKKNLSEAGGSV